MRDNRGNAELRQVSENAEFELHPFNSFREIDAQVTKTGNGDGSLGTSKQW